MLSLTILVHTSLKVIWCIVFAKVQTTTDPINKYNIEIIQWST